MQTPPPHYLYAVLFLFLGCATVGGGDLDPLSGLNKEKIDPALLMKMKQLQRDRQMDQEISILVRTQREIDATQREAIEERGGKIGSVLGDVFTATLPARSLPAISRLEFVLYIEMAKKQRLQ